MTSYVVGNQSILANVNERFEITDFYYPRVGQENQLMGHRNRVAIFVDRNLHDPHGHGWDYQLGYHENTLVSHGAAVNKELGLELKVEDGVDPDHSVFFRRITVKNTKKQKREVTVFFHQDFHMYGQNIGDTATYDPHSKGVVHYKGKRYLLVSGYGSNGYGPDDWTIGLGDKENEPSALEDCKNGKLGQRPVAQGAVDSAIGFTVRVPGSGTESVTHVVACGRTFDEVRKLSDQLRRSKPVELMKRTQQHWESRVEASALGKMNNADPLKRMAVRSLLTTLTQVDQGGAVIAANDASHLQLHRDTYSYCWPRDSAFVAVALDQAGMVAEPHQLYAFLAKVVDPEGYLHHKYLPDGSLGSSWHPWVDWNTKEPQLPIQIDETALPLWSLAIHAHEHEGCLIHETLWPFIKNAADFLIRYRDQNYLPKPSWDLWEERRGITTWSTAAVIAGLRGAADLAEGLGKKAEAKRWRRAAGQTFEAMMQYHFDPSCGCFLRMLNPTEGGEYEKDGTIESANLAPFLFGVLPADHPQVVEAAETIEKELWVRPIGGLARYQNDPYYRQKGHALGTPWILTTLWLAQFYIARRKYDQAKELLEWASQRAVGAGMLPEQVHPETGAPLSALPLTWSHATFLSTYLQYIQARA